MPDKHWWFFIIIIIIIIIIIQKNIMELYKFIWISHNKSWYFTIIYKIVGHSKFCLGMLINSMIWNKIKIDQMFVSTATPYYGQLWILLFSKSFDKNNLDK
jgi:hypothetical protein